MWAQDTYLSNVANGRINPATEDKQDSVVAAQITMEAAIDAIINSGALGRQSTAGESQKLTLTTGTGTGANQVCRECYVKPDPANTASVNINLSAAADVNDGPLDNRWMKVPVSNTNVLNFFSTDADAVVFLMWRN